MIRWVFAALLALQSGLPAADEAPVPFITTPDEVVERMLQLAGTRAGDLVVDLGSGDGRIVIAAARGYGARALGIELDARLVEKARQNARAAGVADRASFVRGDVLETDFSAASVVTVYLLPGLINRLQPLFLERLQPGTRIVSHAFGMTGWKPDRRETMRIANPHPGQGDESTLHLWIVPADVRGVWRAPGTEIRIHQNYQEIELEGRLSGRELKNAKANLRGRAITWEAEGLRFKGMTEGNRIVGELMREKPEPLVLSR